MEWYYIIIVVIILIISGYFAFSKYFKKESISCDDCSQSSCAGCDLVEFKRKVEEARKKGNVK